MTIGSRVFQEYNGRMSEYYRDANCHSFLNNFHNDYYIKFNTIDLANKKYERLEDIIIKFNDMGFAISIEDLEYGGIKVNKTVRLSMTKSAKWFRDSSSDKNQGMLYLHFWEMFRSLIKYDCLYDKVMEYIGKYTNMDIWDVYYLAQQTLTKDLELQLTSYKSYYEPIPLYFINYTSFTKAKRYHCKKREVGDFSKRILDIWLPSSKIAFDINSIKNEPLVNQLKPKKIEYKVVLTKSCYKQTAKLIKKFKDCDLMTGSTLRVWVKGKKLFASNRSGKLVKVDHDLIDYDRMDRNDVRYKKVIKI